MGIGTEALLFAPTTARVEYIDVWPDWFESFEPEDESRSCVSGSSCGAEDAEGDIGTASARSFAD